MTVRRRSTQVGTRQDPVYGTVKLYSSPLTPSLPARTLDQLSNMSSTEVRLMTEKIKAHPKAVREWEAMELEQVELEFNEPLIDTVELTTDIEDSNEQLYNDKPLAVDHYLRKL